MSYIRIFQRNFCGANIITGFGGSQTWVQVLTLCDLGHITYNEHEMGMFIILTL